MTPREQFTFLGNGAGHVYIANPDGTLYLGYPNNRNALGSIISQAPSWRRSIHTSAPTFAATVTAAAAGNITVSTVGGVAIISAPVAIVVGDPTATATAIAAQVNSTTSIPDWSAVAIGDTVYFTCATSGSANNNLAVNMTWTGLSTINFNPVTGGGTNADDFLWRVFLDTDPLSVITVLSGVEITEMVTALPPIPSQEVTPDPMSLSLTVVRKDREMAVKVLGGGTINDIVSPDAIEGDEVTIFCKDGEAAATVANGAGNITLSIAGDFVSTGEEEAITLVLREVGGNPVWCEKSAKAIIDTTTLRANGVPVPATAGVQDLTVLAGGGTTTYIVGNAGVKYFVNLQGTVALAGVSFTVIIDSSSAEIGDTGSIFGYSSQVTYGGAGRLVMAGITIPAAAALTGDWKVDWTIGTAGLVIATLVADPTLANITGTTQIQDASVTDAKIVGMDGSKLVAASVDFTQLSASVNAAIAGNGIQVASATYAAADVGTAAVVLLGITVPANMVAMVESVAYKISAFIGPAHAAGDIGVRCVGANQEQAFATVTKSAAGRWKATNAGEGGAAETMLLLGQDLEIYTTGVGGGGSDIEVIIYFRLIQL